MYYEITIMKDGQHLFATAERSITSPGKLLEVYNLLEQKFPESEGYNFLITAWTKAGTILSEKDIKELERG